MQKAVVSACASTLPDATACWCLLHTNAAASVPPLKQDLVSKAMWFWVCGSRHRSWGFLYVFTNGITCFDGTRVSL